MPRTKKSIQGYVELAPSQLLDDRWREINFDLANGQNILQDLVLPESGGGYVYRDASSVGTASHNRFLYWRSANDVLELVEISSEVILDGNQVRIRFANSPIISAVTFIEFSDSVVIMLATLTSVHRLYLPHPKTTNNSILSELTTDLLFDPSNFYILNTQGSLNALQPTCAASWDDRTFLRCALSFPDSSILVIQFSKNSHQISTFEIKQTGIIGRLWSRIPSLIAKSPNDCDNAVFACVPFMQPMTNDVLLFTLCRDWKIRVFSTSTRECVCTHSMIPQSSFTQSFSSYTSPATEQPMMKIFQSNVFIYLTENRPEFVILNYSFIDGIHVLKEKTSIQTLNWEKLIDFSVTKSKIWALANTGETDLSLCYISIERLINSPPDEETEFEEVWDFVDLIDPVDDLEMSSIKNYVTEIFWSNRFSVATVQKALLGIAGPGVPKKDTMEALEQLAFTRIVDENQDEAWMRFYNYCVQNHHASNKCIGLIVSEDESLISIAKRSNPSFVCPWIMSVDMILQGGPYRAIEFSTSIRGVVEPLNYISTELMNDESSGLFDQRLSNSPNTIQECIQEIVDSFNGEFNISRMNFAHKNHLLAGIDSICDQLDLTAQAKDFGEQILQDSSSRMRSKHNPLGSNIGVFITYELFKRLVNARLVLARDLLIYIYLMKVFTDQDKLADKPLRNLCQDLFSSGRVRRLTDSLRSYAMLVWIARAPIRSSSTQSNLDIVSYIASYFKFFKNAALNDDKSQSSTVDLAIHQNLFMNFLINGGANYSRLMNEFSGQLQTLSTSHYVSDIALNFCKLLWPGSGHLCFVEFLFTHHLDEHLVKYLDLANEWLDSGEHDRHFIKAMNYLVQKRADQAVEILNRLWMNMTQTNLIGRFIDLKQIGNSDGLNQDEELSVNPDLIHRYYDKLIQLFQINNNPYCLVTLINNCMPLLDEDGDDNQRHWVNCFRAKLFQYYLELDEPDDAYRTMVLTSDSSLRINCLRKFIVSHCEKEQWSNLLSYPFIDIKNDLIDILFQKAETSDLSKLNGVEFYKTSYYDLLFASYVSDDEFLCAAEIMYKYSQRLAQEVPGIISIRKQADCLLVALNALRCVPEKEAFIVSGNLYKEDTRTSVLKRAYDCESESSVHVGTQETGISHPQTTSISCKDLEVKYELTRARLRLLGKDQTANAIALSPLKPEETIAQLVTSSMFSAAIDLAILFRAPMDMILEGLTAKFIFIMRLSATEISLHHDLEGGLTDIFTDTFSNIDTYNYVANSTSSIFEKLWRLIDYYLLTYDGIGHRYSDETFSKSFTGTTLLMRTVAQKLLSAGYNVPASLRRMYLTRNPAELLKLLMKYDQLLDASELTVEMVDRVLEPANYLAFSNTFATNDPPPVYLPTHLILLLISFLQEDATNTSHMKAADVLMDRLAKFRRFVKPN